MDARSGERLAEKKGFEKAGMMDGPRAARMAVGKVGWSVAKKAGSTAGRRVVWMAARSADLRVC